MANRVLSRTSATGSPFVDDPPAWLAATFGLRLVVVGADGFIGSHVTRLAVETGASVTAVCLAEPWRLHDFDHPRLERLRLADDCWWTEDASSALASELSRADALVLLAYRPPAKTSPQQQLERELGVNLRGAELLARAASAAGAGVVFSSSADVYGESHEAPVGEDAPPAPTTAYARAKLAAERSLSAYRAPGSLAALRIATVYGPGENGPRAIPSFIRALAVGARPVVHGDGTDVRDYVHVTDVAAAALNAAAAVAAREGPGTVNVGSGIGRTTLEVLDAVRRSFGSDAHAMHVPRTRPRTRLVLDISRARETLGLLPRGDFAESVAAETRWLNVHLSE